MISTTTLRRLFDWPAMVRNAAWSAAGCVLPKLIDRAIDATLIASVIGSIAAAVAVGAAGLAPTTVHMQQRQSIFDRVDLRPSNAGQCLLLIDNAPVGQGWG